MKNVYLFIALLTISASASAKGEYQAMVTAGPVINGKFPHFGNQVASTATGGGAAPAKVSLRLIGRTYTTFSGGTFVPVDSYSYRYEDDRGGVLANDNIDNDETLAYSESIHFIFDPSSVSFVKRLKRTQNYNAEGKIEFLTYLPWRAAQGDFKDSARYHYGYENGQMKTSTFEQNLAGMWTNSIESGIEYSGQLVTAMASDFYRVGFVYDGNSRLVEIVDEQSSGNGIWENKEKHTYEYAGNNVAKHVFSEWSAQSNNWVNKKSWHYIYNNDGVLIAEEEKEWISSQWINLIRHEYSYDGNRNMVTDLRKTWDNSLNVFVDASKEVWTYNIQNLPELITTSTWKDNAWKYTDNDKQYRLYYENYFPAEIEKIAGNNDVKVYPVPAVDLVHVNMTLNSSDDISVALYDVKGTAVYGSMHQAVSELRTEIPVSNLSSGTYFLRVTGSNTSLSKSIIVQH